MDFDEFVQRKQDPAVNEWSTKFRKSSQSICELVGKYRGDDACIFKSLHCGSFNFSVRLHWEDGGLDWLIRFPIPGKSMLPEEKVRNEVAVMKFVEKETNIPIPKIIAHGMGENNPTGLGPFILMTFIEGRKMTDVLKAKGQTADDDHVLDPDLDDSTLKFLYQQMAAVLLELDKHQFSKIGSLAVDAEGTSGLVKHRPLSLNMNEILRCSGLSEECLPVKSFTSSTDYFSYLLCLHRKHLRKQRNSVFGVEDCQEKFICRRLFEGLAPRYTSDGDDAGPFKLICDDFSPGNVLVDDELRIVGVIDWEFCYTAPVQFSSSPPPWLLLGKPADWLASEGSQSFLVHYQPKLELFLSAMREEEDKRPAEATPLSARMRQSFDDKSFWFHMAARNTFDIDIIYWDTLDRHFYGPRSSVKQRIHQVVSFAGDDVRAELDTLARLKSRELLKYNRELENLDLDTAAASNRWKIQRAQKVLNNPPLLTGGIGLLILALSATWIWEKRRP